MGPLEMLRNDEHTGDNRCVPCTIVNLAIVWVLANLVVLAGSFALGGIAVVVGIGIVWLRGYLVPYTPQFAPRLVAVSPVPDEWFHETSRGGALSTASDDEEALVDTLVRAGVVEADEQRVYLDRSFEERWHEAMDDLAALSLSTLATRVEALPTIERARAYERSGQEWIAIDGQPSLVPRHVAVAELGAVQALESMFESDDEWLAMARPLREFLTECPVCKVPFERSSAVSCCGGHTTPRESPQQTLVCPSCEQQFQTLSIETS